MPCSNCTYFRTWCSHKLAEVDGHTTPAPTFCCDDFERRRDMSINDWCRAAKYRVDQEEKDMTEKELIEKALGQAAQDDRDEEIQRLRIRLVKLECQLIGVSKKMDKIIKVIEEGSFW